MTWSAFFSALKAGGVAVRSAPATSSTGRRGGQVANQAVNSDAGITRSASTQAQTAAKPTPREEEAMDNSECMVLDVSAADQHAGFSLAAALVLGRELSFLITHSKYTCCILVFSEGVW